MSSDTRWGDFSVVGVYREVEPMLFAESALTISTGCLMAIHLLHVWMEGFIKGLPYSWYFAKGVHVYFADFTQRA